MELIGQIAKLMNARQVLHVRLLHGVFAKNVECVLKVDVPRWHGLNVAPSCV
jgi:hypothetical protein